MDDGWILTTERLPQWVRQKDGTERIRVIARTRNGLERMANFDRFGGWQVDGVNMELDSVISWIPISGVTR